MITRTKFKKYSLRSMKLVLPLDKVKINFMVLTKKKDKFYGTEKVLVVQTQDIILAGLHPSTILHDGHHV
jgi:hypothetical protein